MYTRCTASCYRPPHLLSLHMLSSHYTPVSPPPVILSIPRRYETAVAYVKSGVATFTGLSYDRYCHNCIWKYTANVPVAAQRATMRGEYCQNGACGTTLPGNVNPPYSKDVSMSLSLVACLCACLRARVCCMRSTHARQLSALVNTCMRASAAAASNQGVEERQTDSVSLSIHHTAASLPTLSMPATSCLPLLCNPQA